MFARQSFQSSHSLFLLPGQPLNRSRACLRLPQPIAHFALLVEGVDRLNELDHVLIAHVLHHPHRRTARWHRDVARSVRDVLDCMLQLLAVSSVFSLCAISVAAPTIPAA